MSTRIVGRCVHCGGPIKPGEVIYVTRRGNAHYGTTNHEGRTICPTRQPRPD